MSRRVLPQDKTSKGERNSVCGCVCKCYKSNSNVLEIYLNNFANQSLWVVVMVLRSLGLAQN